MRRTFAHAGPMLETIGSSREERRRWIIAVLLGAVIAAVSAGFTGQYIPGYRALAESGRPARAAVTALEPRNHRQVHYTFRVGERVYAGIGRAGFGAPPFIELAVGDSIPVHYLPRDPEKSVIGDPRVHLANERGASRTATLGTFLIVTVMAWLDRRRWIWLPKFLRP